MAIEDFEHDSLRCIRCSYCKWISWENMCHPDYMQGCPSVGRFEFHGYSAGGKFNMALAMMKGRIDYTDEFLEMIYKCQMDGNCDVACKTVQDIEPLQCMQELRIKCVNDGHPNPAHALTIEGLRKQDNMLQRPRVDRAKWTKDIPVKDLTKEKAKVAFHAGCRYSFDRELWPTVQTALNVLVKAGLDVGIMGKGEICCGGRAYEMGYADVPGAHSLQIGKALKSAGVKTLVTPCSDCYQAFKVVYDKIGRKLDVEVLHITEYFHRLIAESKIMLNREVPLIVTYHDPCHLGRLAEPWVHWQGEEIKVMNQMIVHEPPKKFRRGGNGVYDIPRDILKNIPGLKFVEMYRIRESAWCCGAGGGVKDAYPDFAIWTGAERLKEAKAVGAKAIVTACPWCTRNFIDTAKRTGEEIEIYDIVDLVEKALPPAGKREVRSGSQDVVGTRPKQARKEA